MVAPPPTRTRRRALKRSRAWTAALLSMLVPGLGHAYVGQIRSGLLFYGVFLVGLVVGLTTFLLIPKQGFNAAFAFAVWLPVYITPMLSAGRAARKLSDDFRPAYPLYVWVAVVLVGTLFAQGFNRGVGALIVKTEKTKSRSMEPGILPGDRLMVNKLSYVFGDVKRDDVVAIAHPAAPLPVVFKRVKFLPGETVELEDAEPGAEPVTLADGQYFVVGDRRHRSVDSREWGPVEAGQILGRVTRVSIHIDPETRRVSWNRIGLPIR